MATKRRPDGKFTRTIDDVARDAEAAKLRARGWTYPQIAEHLGTDKGNAHHMVARVLAETAEEPAAEVRAFELDRLDFLWRSALAVLEAKHFTVSHGKIIYMGEEPLVDDAPVLAAIDRMVKIQERRARLLGLDAPTKAEVGGKLTYEITGVDLDKL